MIPLGQTANERVPHPIDAHERPQVGIAKPFSDDKLEVLIQALAEDYSNASSWMDFVENFRGKEGDFYPKVKHLPHSAAKLLEDLFVTEKRVQMSTQKWTKVQREAALNRGPHQSAKAQTVFMRHEFVAMIHKKQWILLLVVLVMLEYDI
jgi:hypothetical protein